jgi:hypothetical protein
LLRPYCLYPDLCDYFRRLSSAYRLGHFWIKRGNRIEHGFDLHANRVAFGQKAFDLGLESLLLIEQTSDLSPDAGDLPLESFLLLTKRLRQLDGAVNFVFEV